MDKEDRNQAVDIDNDDSWPRARKYASLLFPIPNILLHGIHKLWIEHESNKGRGGTAVSSEALAAIKLIERAPKLKVPLYFAAQSLRPDKFAATTEDDTVKALVDILGPGLFAALLPLLFFHRRFNRLQTHQQWESLSGEIVLNMEMGFIVGDTLGSLGAAEGTMLAGLRAMARGTFLLRTPDLFVKYRNVKRRYLDPNYEHTVWGCDHCQVAAYLIKELGFWPDVLEIVQVLRRIERPILGPLNQTLRNWFNGMKCLEVVRNGEAVTKLGINISSSEEAELLRRVRDLLNGESKFKWMSKTGRDGE